MAHQLDAEAGDAPLSDDLDSAAATLADYFGDEEEESTLGAPDPDEDRDEAEETDEQDDEPETAIEAPASLNAEEKARFAQLPEEAQRMIAEVESRRNGQVQTATTKAAEAQRAADARAAQADAQAKAVYAQQLQQFAAHLAPQRPDPALANTDPAAYIALNAQFDAAKAQHDQFVQQVQALGQEATADMTQAEIAERDRGLLAIPEVQNEETRSAFFEKATAAANVLGLDTAALNRATAGEWKALRQVSEWQDKAGKYDAAMAKQMQRVREGKRTQATKPNAVRSGAGERAYRDARVKLRETGSLDDAAAAIARLG